MNLPEQLDRARLCEHVALLADNFLKLFAVPLAPVELTGQQRLEWLWQADFALLSHGTEADPIFNFANRTALELFEMDYQEFTQLPSRCSAEPVRREERAALLAQVTEFGCIDNYSGVRIASSGRRFTIQQAKVWNLTDSQGRYFGQAAMFADWQPLDKA